MLRALSAVVFCAVLAACTSVPLQKGAPSARFADRQMTFEITLYDELGDDLGDRSNCNFRHNDLSELIIVRLARLQR